MLEHLDKNKVFQYFEEISAVPRGSYYNEKISEYLCDFAKKHNLDYVTDDALNVLIRKPGTGSGADKAPVILQGHMDMVCVKEPEINHDFKTEGLELKLDGDNLFANGTTLGGDDGIALAYSLALLDSDEFIHPPLEVLFTTDEEIGMDGAIAFDASQLKGKMMLNVDNEQEGEILVSCAGGSKADIDIPGKKQETEGAVFTLLAEGLRGGHSGVEIYYNQTNAVIVLCRALWKLPCSYQLMEVIGGNTDNVIPSKAEITFVVDAKYENETEQTLTEVTECLQKELRGRESNISLSFSKKGVSKVEAFEESVSEKIVDFCNLCITGVQTMSGNIEGMVESSLNLGTTETKKDGVHLGFALRSQKKSYKKYMEKQLVKLANQFGLTAKISGDYPAWDYKEDSVLRDIATEEFEKIYGDKPIIKGIHAGLECGVLSEKIEGLDIISFGPTIRDIHSTKETLSISSAIKCFDFIVAILNKLAIS